MIDQAAAVPAVSGPEAMERLADRLATLAPAQHPFEPAHEGGQVTEHVQDSARRRRSLLRRMIDAFNAACAFIPYALVALALRLVMARLFFLDGQTRVEGTPIPLTWRDFEFSAVLPLQLKAEAASVFWRVPHVPSAVVAWAVAGAEFALPVLLVAGLLTRFSALMLFAVTVLLQLFVAPEALWSAHVYWASILLVLVSLGAGPVSVDALVKFLARR